MTTRSSAIQNRPAGELVSGDWIQIGAITALVSIVAVLAVQAVALSVWPEVARFRPLDNYVRTALFVLVPVIVATGLFAWLSRRSALPVRTFLTISAIVLGVGFIPDYALPDPNKTVLASTIAAGLHVVAAVFTVGLLTRLYRRKAAGR
jgi:hypothetical protein